MAAGLPGGGTAWRELRSTACATACASYGKVSHRKFLLELGAAAMSAYNIRLIRRNTGEEFADATALFAVIFENRHTILRNCLDVGSYTNILGGILNATAMS